MTPKPVDEETVLDDDTTVMVDTDDSDPWNQISDEELEDAEYEFEEDE